MDITFNCGKCGQSLTIDRAGAGQLIDCPKCGTAIEVPYKSKPADNMPPMYATPPIPTTKLCPYCAEEILGAAIKCKHCGEFLNGTGVRDRQSAASSRPGGALPSKSSNPGVAAVLSLVIPGAGQMYKGSLGDGFAFLFVTSLFYGMGIARLGQEAVEERERFSGPYLGDDMAPMHFGLIFVIAAFILHVYSVVHAYQANNPALLGRASEWRTCPSCLGRTSADPDAKDGVAYRCRQCGTLWRATI